VEPLSEIEFVVPLLLLFDVVNSIEHLLQLLGLLFPIILLYLLGFLLLLLELLLQVHSPSLILIVNHEDGFGPCSLSHYGLPLLVQHGFIRDTGYILEAPLRIVMVQGIYWRCHTANCK